jgi:hypothetical protein
VIKVNLIPIIYEENTWELAEYGRIELNVLTGQCLKRRMENIELVRKETLEWQKFRNNKNAKVNWQFTTEDARVKLSRLYLTIEE